MTNQSSQAGRAHLEHYVDCAVAGEFLGIHARTVQQMARGGTIPAHPLGEGPRRTWRFKLSELDEWMRSQVNSQRRPCPPERRKVQ
jgi:excisionase family DNA binding protein